jgi:type I restriction enzyme R subunit
MAGATIKVTEDSYAEQPALEWLTDESADLHWSYLPGSELAPDAPAAERKLWSDVVLIGRLEAAVRRINPELPEEAVRRAVELTLTTTSPIVIEDHRDFHELLLLGVPVTYLDNDGIERSPRAKLIDWADLASNEFLAVNQFRIVMGKKNRRPDILLFVNGLPLGQVELKNPADEAATADSAVNQVLHYTETIPGLYRYVEIVGVSDLLQARVGTITTPSEHFVEWKSLDLEDDAKLTALEVMLRGAFAPATFLDLIRNFTLFETDGARSWKVMAKYHQFHAVGAAVEETARAMRGDQRAGVVWHTQGGGKSYTMAFYVTKLRRDARFENPTVVAVTDRKDLDTQLYETFARQRYLAPQQAESIEGDGDSLYRLLDRPAGGIIFTTIQKFQPPGEVRAEYQAAASDAAEGVRLRAPMPVISERSNIVVMADEAHRSEYGNLAENITTALPNAVRIGFTGTPIERHDRSTRNVFGEYISVYRMAQAQADGVTVPIYYESRQIHVDADPEELRAVEEVLETEEDEAKNKLITSWAKLEKVVGSGERLDKVAADIAEHYTRRCEGFDGKAMVVGYSRRIAAELTERLQRLLGEDAVTCVMTAQATEEPLISQFRRSKQEMKDVQNEFKDPDSKLRVVVVRDMWLTGFDVPPLHTLYVDKPMRDHGLLQAIARVNRVFRAKPGGLVVDYIGIGEDLRESLTAYSSSDTDDVSIPLATAVLKLRETHEILCDLLHGIEWRPTDGMTVGQRATVLGMGVKQALDRFLADEEQTQLFLDHQLAFSKWMGIAGAHPIAVELRYDSDFFASVAKQLRSLAPKSGEASTAAEQAVKQFFSTGLGAGEVTDVFSLVGEDRPEISVLSDEFLDRIAGGIEQPNLQVALLRKLIDGQIRARVRSNNMQAKQFSEQVEKLLLAYENKQLTTAEIVKALVDLAKTIRDSRRRHEDLGLTEEEAAFYDALAGGVEDIKADPQLKKLAGELVRNIRADLSVDWADRRSAEAAIRAKIKRLLRRNGYKPPKPAGNGGGGGDSLEYAADLILTQARTLYRYWPDVETDEPVLFAERHLA